MAHAYDFVGNTADGAFVVDRSQRIVLWNSAAGRILGYDATEVLGKTCYSVVKGRDADGCALCRGACTSFELANTRAFPPRRDLLSSTKDGREVWLNVTTLVLRSRAGKFLGLAHLFRDVTKRHESMRVLREFAAVVGELGQDGEPASLRVVASAPADADITRREREILRLLVQGSTTSAIAERLCISERTVRNHVTNILIKLGLHSRVEAVAYSIRNGLV
jgi:PAS domain S-box-containing protein